VLVSLWALVHFMNRVEYQTLYADLDPQDAQSIVQKLEVGLLEQALGGTLGVRGVGDDDIKAVLVVVQELEAIANVDLALGVLVTLGHLGQVLLGETDNGLLLCQYNGRPDSRTEDR